MEQGNVTQKNSKKKKKMSEILCECICLCVSFADLDKLS